MKSGCRGSAGSGWFWCLSSRCRCRSSGSFVLFQQTALRCSSISRQSRSDISNQETGVGRLMTCLHWKSDARPRSPPLPNEGTGDPARRQRRGHLFQASSTAFTRRPQERGLYTKTVLSQRRFFPANPPRGRYRPGACDLCSLCQPVAPARWTCRRSSADSSLNTCGSLPARLTPSCGSSFRL
jgi:hypothetical protein